MSSYVQKLMALAEDLELFRSPDGKVYATCSVSDHFENWELGSRQFTNLLRNRCYSTSKELPPSSIIQEAVRTLEAKAEFEGAEHSVFLRVAEHSGRLYLDLANDTWEAVEIDADSWRLVARPAVKFRRTRGMLPLPAPVRGGSIDELRPLANINSSDWPLVVAWLIAGLRPSGPYPILVNRGEHWTAKTTLAKLLRALIDPSSLDVRGEPQNGHDLIIAASNSWVLSLDNLSRIPAWLSD
jgi:hypothetical protein